jgi:hypothetical protein
LTGSINLSLIASVGFTSAYLLGAAPLPPKQGSFPMPDDTTLSDAARLLSPQLLQDARSDTARGWAARALCAGVDPEVFFPASDDPAAEARDICMACPYAASAWPMRSPLTSGSASGAALIPGSGAPRAGGWNGVDRLLCLEAGPLRDPGTTTVAPGSPRTPGGHGRWPAPTRPTPQVPLSPCGLSAR